MTKAFIFKNTNQNVAWLSAKYLANYSSEFIAVFDKEYDILKVQPKLYQKIYYFHTENVSTLLENYSVEVLDFDLDMFANKCSTYEEYLSKKITSNPSKINLKQNVNIELDKIIASFDKHQYVDVFLSVKDEEYLKICEDYLKDICNIIYYEDNSIIDLHYIISKCSFVITDNNIEYLIAKEIQKPVFVIVDNYKVNVAKEFTTFIFDPYKNDTYLLPPVEFCNDRRNAELINSQIIDHSSIKDLLTVELQDALDKFKIPYVTYLPS